MSELQALQEGAVSFHAVLGRVEGAGPIEALFMSEILYWTKWAEDGWVYRTQGQIQETRCLNRYQQEKARDYWKDKGVLEEERRGMPAKLYYKVKQDELRELLDSVEPARQSGDSQHPSMGTDDIQECGGSPNKSGEGEQSRARGTAGTEDTDNNADKDSPPVREDGSDNGQQQDTEDVVPVQVQNLALQTYGNVPSMVSDFYDTFPPDWIPLAIEKTKENGVNSWKYTRKILQRWWKQGGPDADQQGSDDEDDDPDYPTYEELRERGETYTEDQWDYVLPEEVKDNCPEDLWPPLLER